jgi:hypothetical protein
MRGRRKRRRRRRGRRKPENQGIHVQNVFLGCSFK